MNVALTSRAGCERALGDSLGDLENSAVLTIVFVDWHSDVTFCGKERLESRPHNGQPQKPPNK